MSQPRPQDKQKEARPAGWPRARGRHYLEVMGDLHRKLNPEWYLEIGSGRGNSLSLASCRSIAVDPEFRLASEVMGRKSELHMFCKTSDAFFAGGIAEKLTPTIDLAFIDGMHLFDYVLRDFIATEKLCRADSVILLHDLVPFSPAAAEREWVPERTKGWSGDVWKMSVILREYRPDLDFKVLDPRPSGLGVVTKLDPENTVLEAAYDEIVAKFMDETIEGYGTKKLADILRMQPPDDVVPASAAEGAAQ